MWEDTIVKAVRRVREEHSARFGHDLERIYRELKWTFCLPPPRSFAALRMTGE
jgi:hypothetical protein